MHPILFQIGPLTIYGYGVMLALGVVISTMWLARDAARHGIDRQVIFDFTFWVMVSGIVGARVFYVSLTWEYFQQHLLEILMLNKGGLAWQGGFLGGSLAGISFVRRRGLSMRTMMDLVAPYLALGQSIGRIGCFLNGCCYGKPWAGGIYFPVHQAHLHPTQLYETAGLLVIFLVLKMAQRRSLKPGMIFVLYLWLAALERFVVEFWRDDHVNLWLGLSLFQYIALSLFLLGLFIFVRFNK